MSLTATSPPGAMPDTSKCMTTTVGLDLGPTTFLDAGPSIDTGPATSTLDTLTATLGGDPGGVGASSL